MPYIVTGPLVITKKQDGSDLYLYENAQLPESVSDEEALRLLNLGLVDEVSAKEAAAAPEPTEQSN